MRNSRNLAYIVNNEFKFHTGSSIFIAGDDGTRAFHSNAPVAVGDVVVATCASADAGGVFSSRPIISEKSRNNSSKSSAGGGGGGPLGVLG